MFGLMMKVCQYWKSDSWNSFISLDFRKGWFVILVGSSEHQDSTRMISRRKAERKTLFNLIIVTVQEMNWQLWHLNVKLYFRKMIAFACIFQIIRLFWMMNVDQRNTKQNVIRIRLGIIIFFIRAILFLLIIISNWVLHVQKNYNIFCFDSHVEEQLF